MSACVWVYGATKETEELVNFRHFCSVFTKRRHGLGRTGSGKTNLILGLISSDLSQGRSIAVINLRGDLTDRDLHNLAKTGTASSELTLLSEKEQIIGSNPLTGPSGPTAGRMVFDALPERSKIKPVIASLEGLAALEGGDHNWINGNNCSN